MFSIVILPALLAITTELQQDLHTFKAKIEDYRLVFKFNDPSWKTRGFYKNNRLYYFPGERNYPTCAQRCRNKEAKLWRLSKQDDLEYLYDRVLTTQRETESIWAYTTYLDDKSDNGSVQDSSDSYIVGEDQIITPGHTISGDHIDREHSYPKNKCTAITRLSKRKFRIVNLACNAEKVGCLCTRSAHPLETWTYNEDLMKVKNYTLISATLWLSQLKELTQRYTVFYDNLPHTYQHQREARDSPHPSTEVPDSEDASTLTPAVPTLHSEVTEQAQGSGLEPVTARNTEEGEEVAEENVELTETFESHIVSLAEVIKQQVKELGTLIGENNDRPILTNVLLARSNSINAAINTFITYAERLIYRQDLLVPIDIVYKHIQVFQQPALGNESKLIIQVTNKTDKNSPAGILKKLTQKVKSIDSRLQLCNCELLGPDSSYIIQSISLISAVISLFSFGIGIYTIFKKPTPFPTEDDKEVTSDSKDDRHQVNAVTRYAPTAPFQEEVELLPRRTRIRIKKLQHANE